MLQCCVREISHKVPGPNRELKCDEKLELFYAISWNIKALAFGLLCQEAKLQLNGFYVIKC